MRTKKSGHDFVTLIFFRVFLGNLLALTKTFWRRIASLIILPVVSASLVIWDTKVLKRLGLL